MGQRAIYYLRVSAAGQRWAMARPKSATKGKGGDGGVPFFEVLDMHF